MSGRHNVHATGIVLGKTGILMRGPSGSGKSLLALSLLDAWENRGEPAKLVSDDRVDIEPGKTGLTMLAPPKIAGLIELRGRGIVSRPHAERAPLHLVIDFVAKLERMVEEEDLSTELYGVTIARCPVPKIGVTGLGHQLLLVTEALRVLTPKPARARQKIT
jgi:serine kinase of HPr protein (carbohydrate metabolism regulator)